MWLPPQLLFSFGRVAQQCLNFCGAEIAWINSHDNITYLYSRGIFTYYGCNNCYLINTFAFEPESNTQFSCRPFNKLSNGILHTCCNNKVLSLVLLQHHPLHTHIILGVPPITKCIYITHIQTPL